MEDEELERLLVDTESDRVERKASATDADKILGRKELKAKDEPQVERGKS